MTLNQSVVGNRTMPYIFYFSFLQVCERITMMLIYNMYGRSCIIDMPDVFH